MAEAKMKINGSFNAKLFDKYGNLIDEKQTPNTVTDAGFDGIIQRGFDTGTGSASFNYIAIGSGTGAAAAGDTAFGSEAARAQGTYAYTDGTAAFTLTNTFAAGTATGSIAESGILNASSSGQLFCRQTFGVITKGASDSLQVTWTGSLS